MKPAPTIEELREALAPLWDTGAFRLVLLFGSVAAGRATKDSDLDLGFLPLADGGLDEVGITAECVRLTHWNDIDVVDLSRADPLMLMHAATHGIVLFARDRTDFTEFASLAFRRYVDTEKLRRGERRGLDLFEQRHESD